MWNVWFDFLDWLGLFLWKCLVWLLGLVVSTDFHLCHNDSTFNSDAFFSSKLFGLMVFCKFTHFWWNFDSGLEQKNNILQKCFHQKFRCTERNIKNIFWIWVSGQFNRTWARNKKLAKLFRLTIYRQFSRSMQLGGLGLI